MMLNPKLLSDCGNILIIDDSEKGRYSIEIAGGDYLLLAMGFASNKSAANFQHPNIIASVKRIHEFKHYLHNGGKYWSASAGIDKYLLIPKNKIMMLPVKGYSFVKAEINGVKVSFNCSGGTYNGWTDFLNSSVHISVNHKLSDLKKICEVAVRNPELEAKLEIKGLEADKEGYWQELADKANSKLKTKIFDMIESGKQVIICVNNGLSYNGMKSFPVNELVRNYKTIREGEKSGELEACGRIRYMIGMSAFTNVRIKPSQVNWSKTFADNNLG